MITMRNDLKPDELYLEGESVQYFYSPNPPGVIWITPQEADEIFGEDVTCNVIDQLEKI